MLVRCWMVRIAERVGKDIKRIGMITLSNAVAAAHMQMPLLRAKGKRKEGREEGWNGSQPSKEAHSLALRFVFAHSASLGLTRRGRRRYITRHQQRA